MSSLFDLLPIRGVMLPNRIVVCLFAGTPASPALRTTGAWQPWVAFRESSRELYRRHIHVLCRIAHFVEGRDSIHAPHPARAGRKGWHKALYRIVSCEIYAFLAARKPDPKED